MAVTALVTTAGASDANAYVSLTVADQYHEDRPAADSVWAAATTAQKNAAILWATELLDALYDWAGWAVTSTQRLSWPRNGLITKNRYTLPSTTIPTEIQHATAEFARQLLVADRAGDSDIETQGITDLSVGPIRLSFKDSVTAKVIPDAVYHLIPIAWGTPRGRVTGVRELVRA